MAISPPSRKNRLLNVEYGSYAIDHLLFSTLLVYYTIHTIFIASGNGVEY